VDVVVVVVEVDVVVVEVVVSKKTVDVVVEEDVVVVVVNVVVVEVVVVVVTDAKYTKTDPTPAKNAKNIATKIIKIINGTGLIHGFLLLASTSSGTDTLFGSSLLTSKYYPLKK
jgi:hypothetical protein